MSDFTVEEFTTQLRYSGRVISGITSPLLIFTKSDYVRALEESRVILLYFFDDREQICKTEFLHISTAFHDLEEENVIGFILNFNETEAKRAEKIMREEMNVVAPNTKMIVKDGTILKKDASTWIKEKYIAEIKNALLESQKPAEE